MKIWIGTHPWADGIVIAFYKKPTKWNGTSWAEGSSNSLATGVCGHIMRRLLRGTGLRLPRHGTNRLVEVEIAAKKPRRKK